jgi:phosphate transport system permease protein
MDTRKLKDAVSSRLMLLATLFSISLIIIMTFSLFINSMPILRTQSIGELLFSSSWHPWKGEFGFYPFIMGTFWVTLVAMVISIPLCIFSSIYLAEYASARLRKMMKPLIDLLAGVPSVVFGMCAVLVIVPLIKDIAPFFGSDTTGYCILSGGIILAIMVFPVIISVSVEVFRSVPDGVREASLAVGATKWQTVKHVVIRTSLPGVVSAVLLGFGRAFGETLAVMMVVGNVIKVPSSVFDSACPIPALIANQYGEMMSVPLYESALLFAALILLLIVSIFNIIARIVLRRTRKVM